MSSYYEIAEYGAWTILVTMLLIAVSSSLSSISDLSPARYIGSARKALLLIYIYLTIMSIIGVVPGRISGYTAVHLFIVIMLIVSSILIGRSASRAEDMGTYITGIAIEVVGVAIGLVFLNVVFQYWYWYWLVPTITTVALATFVWLRVEEVLSRARGPYSYAVLWSAFLRRVAVTISCIVTALIVLYFNGGLVAELIPLTYEVWALRGIEGAFWLILLISLTIMTISLLPGLVGGFMLLASEQGLRGLPLLVHAKSKEVSPPPPSGALRPTPTGVAALPQEAPTAPPEVSPPTPAQEMRAPLAQREEAVLGKPRAELKCPYCGASAPMSAKFCPQCGAYLEADEGTRLYVSREEEKGRD